MDHLAPEVNEDPEPGSLAMLAAIVFVAAMVAWTLLSRGGSVHPSELEAGDCFALPDTSFEVVERAECTEPHEARVFAIVESTGPYPEEMKVVFADPLTGRATTRTNHADRTCQQRFLALVSSSDDLPEDAAARYLIADRLGWGRGDTTVRCVVVSPTGALPAA